MLNADHPVILNGIQDAIDGKEPPSEIDDDELISTLFKPEYRELAKSLQLMLPLFNQLEDELQK